VHCRLEERRIAKGAAYHEKKQLARRQLADAKKNATVDKKVAKQLQGYGY
jgi:large subunit ribosomal protein L13Ae